MRNSPIPFAGAWMTLAVMLSLTACGNASSFDRQALATSPAESDGRTGASSAAVASKPPIDAPAASLPPSVRPASTGAESATSSPAASAEPSGRASPNEATGSDQETEPSGSVAVNAASDPEFDPRNPTLSGLSLGMSEADVNRLLGAPAQQYDMEDGDAAVLMNEYAGVTVGFGPKGTVVYVEVSSAGADTGIAGVAIGSGGQAAASALSLPLAPDARVIACPVAGGLLKIDLTPDTRQVISVKLVAES